MIIMRWSHSRQISLLRLGVEARLRQAMSTGIIVMVAAEVVVGIAAGRSLPLGKQQLAKFYTPSSLWSVMTILWRWTICCWTGRFGRKV